MLKISAVTAAQVPRSQSEFGYFDGRVKIVDNQRLAG